MLSVCLSLHTCGHRAQEAVWSPQDCDAAWKPDHHGCSSRSLRPGRHGEQTSEVAMFNSSQNALVFLKHLPFKLKEKWRKLHLSILSACKAALLPVVLQISEVLEMRWKRSCRLQCQQFCRWRCPCQLVGLSVLFSLAHSSAKIQHLLGSSQHLYGLCSSQFVSGWGTQPLMLGVLWQPFLLWPDPCSTDVFGISVASLLWHMGPVPAPWERTTW